MESVVRVFAVFWFLCLSGTHGVSLRESCYTDDECPSRAACRPKYCEMFICQCEPGYFHFDSSSDICTKASLLGQNCSADTRCIAVRSACNSTSGVCECLDNHTPSRDGFKCSDNAFGVPPNLDDDCTGNAQCDFFSTCVNGKCACKSAFIPWTWEEKWLLYPRPTFLSCKTADLGLDMCNDVQISMPNVPNHKPRPTQNPTSTDISMDTPPMKPLLPPRAHPRFVPPPP